MATQASAMSLCFILNEPIPAHGHTVGRVEGHEIGPSSNRFTDGIPTLLETARTNTRVNKAHEDHAEPKTTRASDQEQRFLLRSVPLSPTKSLPENIMGSNDAKSAVDGKDCREQDSGNDPCTAEDGRNEEDQSKEIKEKGASGLSIDGLGAGQSSEGSTASGSSLDSQETSIEHTQRSPSKTVMRLRPETVEPTMRASKKQAKKYLNDADSENNPAIPRVPKAATLTVPEALPVRRSSRILEKLANEVTEASKALDKQTSKATVATTSDSGKAKKTAMERPRKGTSQKSLDFFCSMVIRIEGTHAVRRCNFSCKTFEEFKVHHRAHTVNEPNAGTKDEEGALQVSEHIQSIQKAPLQSEPQEDEEKPQNRVPLEPKEWMPEAQFYSWPAPMHN